jgi:hypothetical protein
MRLIETEHFQMATYCANQPEFQPIPISSELLLLKQKCQYHETAHPESEDKRHYNY